VRAVLKDGKDNRNRLNIRMKSEKFASVLRMTLSLSLSFVPLHHYSLL
jgi:hypothetical protein